MLLAGRPVAPDTFLVYYEIRGSGRPLVLLHGGRPTTDLNFGPSLEPLAAGRQVIAMELQGHVHTTDAGRPMTIEALAGDVDAALSRARARLCPPGRCTPTATAARTAGS